MRKVFFVRCTAFVLSLVFLLLLAGSVFGAATIFWLRGSDLSGPIEGGTHNFLSATPPSSASTKTISEFSVEKGRGELTRWYSSSFTAEFLLSGELFFWASKFELLKGNAQFRLALYEFETKDELSTLIARSDWFDFKGSFQEAKLVFENAFFIKSKNRLKLVVEYNSLADNSVIRLVTDDAQPFQEIVWNTPLGTRHSAFGVKNTAAILLNICSTSSIECYVDLECNDNQELTFDTCINSGSCDAECIYEPCDTKCFSNADCADSNPLTVDLCSGLGECNSVCSNDFCSVACQTNSDCNDENSLTVDECVHAGSCVSFCKNTLCEKENCAVGELNVCGNDLCEFSENCLSDCAQNGIELLDVKSGDYFFFGEPVLVKAKLKSFSSSTRVALSGLFGEQELFDDGKGADKKANDGIFSGQFSVPSVQGETGKVTITSTTGQRNSSLVKYYSIVPRLDVELKTDKDAYFETEEIMITASASRKGVPLGQSIVLLIENNGVEVLKQEIFQNEYGLYSYNYRLSSLDEEGKLKITVRAMDKFQNSGLATKTVLFSGGGRVSKGLEIEILSLSQEIQKLEKQGIKVRVNDVKGHGVESAAVEVKLPNGSTVELSEDGKGLYSGFFELSEKVISGEQEITVRAKKIVGAKELEALATEKIIVLPLPLNFEVMGLEKTSYLIGEPINLKIFGKVNGRPAKLKKVTVFFEGKEFKTVKENNYFLAKIVLDGKKEGLTKITINATDIYQNTGFSSVSLELKGVYPPYFVGNNLHLFFGLILLFLFIFGGVFFVLFKKKEQERLKKQKAEIIKELKELQEKYFKGGFLERTAYDEQVLKYEGMIEKINKKIGGGKK